MTVSEIEVEAKPTLPRSAKANTAAQVAHAAAAVVLSPAFQAATVGRALVPTFPGK